jgi:hypothetical protein
MERPELLNMLLRQFSAPRYLEIGVHKAETLRLIEADERVAVDPMFQFDTKLTEFHQPPTSFFEVTSDRYFEQHVDVSRPFDVVFIDGLHSFEQTFRDFTNVMNVTSRSSFIVFDDIGPSDFVEAAPGEIFHKIHPLYPRTSTGWMGDVYKMMFMIETFFPFLQMRIPVEAPNQLVAWYVSHTRPVEKAMKKSMTEIAGAQFADLILSRPHFKPVPIATILEEYAMRAAA